MAIDVHYLNPHHPELLDDPKAAFIELVRSSPNERLKRTLVPDDPTKNAEGPVYTSRMERFVRHQWSVSNALQNAASLRRCVQAVEDLLEEEKD